MTPDPGFPTGVRVEGQSKGSDPGCWRGGFLGARLALHWAPAPARRAHGRHAPPSPAACPSPGRCPGPLDRGLAGAAAGPGRDRQPALVWRRTGGLPARPHPALRRQPAPDQPRAHPVPHRTRAAGAARSLSRCLVFRPAPGPDRHRGAARQCPVRGRLRCRRRASLAGRGCRCPGRSRAAAGGPDRPRSPAAARAPAGNPRPGSALRPGGSLVAGAPAATFRTFAAGVLGAAAYRGQRRPPAGGNAGTRGRRQPQASGRAVPPPDRPRHEEPGPPAPIPCRHRPAGRPRAGALGGTGRSLRLLRPVAPGAGVPRLLRPDARPVHPPRHGRRQQPGAQVTNFQDARPRGRQTGAHPQQPSGATAMEGFNIWAILTAAVASFVLGGVWYSPMLFGKAWQREVGLSDEELAKGNMAVIFGSTLVLCFIASFVFAMFLGPRPPLALGLGAGFSAGLCWVASSFGINYMFERKSFKLFAINGGYHTLQFTVIGLILALWPAS